MFTTTKSIYILANNADEWHAVPVTIRYAFYPSQPETSVDPEEPAFVDIESVMYESKGVPRTFTMIHDMLPKRVLEDLADEIRDDHIG